MAKHMDSVVRGQIQFWIESHKSVAWIARSLGKPPSTIWRELINHRMSSDKGYGCSNRLCARFDVCTRPSYGATDYKSLAKNKPGCFEACPDFRCEPPRHNGKTRGRMTDYGFRRNAGSRSSAIKLRIYFWNPSLLLDAAQFFHGWRGEPAPSATFATQLSGNGVKKRRLS